MKSNAAYAYVKETTSGIETKSNVAYGQVQSTVPTDSTPTTTAADYETLDYTWLSVVI